MAYYIKIFFLTLKVFHCYPSFNSLLYSLKTYSEHQHNTTPTEVHENLSKPPIFHIIKQFKPFQSLHDTLFFSLY